MENRKFLVIQPGMFGHRFHEMMLSILLDNNLIEVVDNTMVVLNQSLNKIGSIESSHDSVVLKFTTELQLGTISGKLKITFPYHQVMMIIHFL